MGVLIRNGSIVTFDPSRPALEKGWVLLENGVVESLGAGAPPDAGASGRAAHDVIDAGGRYVLPGLVCAHHHFYSALARGFVPDGPPAADFTSILEKLWWPFDRALSIPDIEVSAELTLLECLRRGVTSVIDHHESQGAQEGVLQVLAGAVRGAGLRASLCLGASDRYGKGLEGLKETRAFLSTLSPDDRRIRGMVGLHASFTVEEQTLQVASELADEKGVGMHVHLAEDRADVEGSLRRFGARPLERFRKAGLLGGNALLVHGVHLDLRELDVIAETGALLVHNPESNLNNAVGGAPVPEALERGIAVGLGTDGMSSDVLSQARVALLVRRHATGDPRTGFLEAWRMLSEGNPEIASRCFGAPTGRIREGFAGDAVVFDEVPPTPLTPRNVAGHVLYGLAGAVSRDVVCAGIVVRRDGRTLTLESEDVSARALSASGGLWKRVKEKGASDDEKKMNSRGGDD